jgi:hypothetical protein
MTTHSVTSRSRLIGRLLVLGAISSCHGIATADLTPPLRYSTTWLGNSFGGGSKWVQNFAERLCVLPDGTCVVGSFWDEAGREVGLYKAGQPIAHLAHTHMRGGKAIAATDQYVFYAHTCAREDQPAVKAGEARRGKPHCLFGVSRWTHDGKVAPFEGGKTHFNNMVVFREALDNHDLIPRGLAVAGNLLYISDTLDNRVRVLNLQTMKPERDFAAEKPERLAVDSSGNVWLISSGGKRILSFTSEGKPRSVDVPLPDGSSASSLGFDREGRLLVTDNGPRQQVLFFDVADSPARIVEAFGEEGGIYGGARPGRCGPLRLCGPTGAGFDGAGNFYVACNVPRGGTVLRCYSPDRRLLWELLGLEFVDVADARPGSDGQDVFTATNRYAFDPTAPAGSGWRWTAHTLDPIHFPEDLRLRTSILQCATSIRILGGETFLCQRGMWQGVLGFYRLEGDRAVPSAVLSTGPIREEKSTWTPTHQPAQGRWFWRDVNGNGKFDAGEYTPTPGPTGEYWASNVDSRGDIWQAGRDSGIWRWRFMGLDDKRNPRYDVKPRHWPMPEPFTDLLRTEYDPALDVMYLTGQTRDRPIRGGEWGTAGTVVVRYDDWSTKPRLRYRTDLPYQADKLFMVSFHVAGDLFFTVDCKQAHVSVHDNRTGKFLGTMQPGPEVGRESGWVDFCDALRATRLKNGSYLVFVEEDWKAKTTVYRLHDPFAGDGK